MNHTEISSPFQWYAGKPALHKEGGERGGGVGRGEGREKEKKPLPEHVGLTDFYVVHR